MSTKLQQLGIDRWPMADRLALMSELRASLPDDWARWSERSETGGMLHRDDEEMLPWPEVCTDLGGEG